MRVMSSPSNRIVPLLAGSVPATTAMNVDLPAPFGPISPVIWPLGTSRETPSTACMPSKCRWTSSATSIGASGLSMTSGCADTIHQLCIGTAFEDSTGLGPDAFRPKPEKSQDEQADRDPLERGDEIRRTDVHMDEQTGHLLEADGYEERAQDGPYVVAPAADDEGGEQDDGLGVEPGRRGPDGQEADEDRAGETGDGAADDEDCHLQRNRVLAQRGGRHLVLAHGPERAAVGRVDDPGRYEPDQADTDRGQPDVQVKVVVGATVDLVVQRLRDQRETRRAVEKRARIVDHRVRD